MMLEYDLGGCLKVLLKEARYQCRVGFESLAK